MSIRPLLFVTVASALVFVGCSSDRPPSTEKASTSSSPSTSASPEDTGPRVQPVWNLSFDAGTYELELDTAATTKGGTYPNVRVTLPDDWTNIDGWGVNTGGEADARWMGITFWHVKDVFVDPCDGGKRIDPGPSVADLAEALGEQPLRSATEPVGIEVDGYKGLQVEWSVPDDFDFTTCGDGYFDSWNGRYQQGPGRSTDSGSSTSTGSDW